MSNKQYSFFVKPYTPSGESHPVGHNYVGMPKANFVFKMKVYVDLPVKIGDKSVTFREYNFLKLQNTLYGIPLNKIKQNVKIEDAVNFFLGNKQPVPVIDLNNPSIVSAQDLLATITIGMEKTKEFYAKHPPLPASKQEIKVFETTINRNPDGSFKVNNLTTKYFNGFIELNGKKFANVYFPFDGQNKTFLINEKDYIDNKDGSFSLNFPNGQASYLAIPTKNLKTISDYDFSLICSGKTPSKENNFSQKNI